MSAQQFQFLLRVTPPALASEREYEIPACVTLAQAILESATAAGWGSSPLFRLANNPFGIKYCHFGPDHRAIGPSGHRPIGSSETPGSDEPMNRSADQPIPEDYGAFDARTWEIENGQKKIIEAQFQRFPNLDEAFRAHALLLRAPRYRPAFAVRGDWKKFAARLGPKVSPVDSEHCGYSTNPSYAAELIRLVGLYRLDDPRAVEWYATGADPGPGYGVRDTGHGIQDTGSGFSPLAEVTHNPMRPTSGSAITRSSAPCPISRVTCPETQI